MFFSGLALTECWSALFLTATIFFALRASRTGRATAGLVPPCRTPTDAHTVGQADRGTGENRTPAGLHLLSFHFSLPLGALAAGAACAALVYFHPEFLGLPAAFAVAALAAPGRRKWLPLWAVGTAVVVAALVPWWVRNYELLGRPVIATTRLGTTLWDGVRPGATGESDMRFELERAAETRGLNEIEYDAHYRRLARAAITQEPGRMARLAMTKAARLWSPTPNAAEAQAWYYRWASAAGWAVMMVGAALGAVFLLRRRGGTATETAPSPYALPSRERGEEEAHTLAPIPPGLQSVAPGFSAAALVLLLVPVVWVTLVHLVLVGSVRYRVPVEPLLCILAGCGYGLVGPGRYGRNRRTGER